ncbi:acyl-CoA dehydrogenase family protein [Rickettsiales bacterium]|nr:acyl-CoA dehydrogenase family protein [Rickettsiales bacterium]
MTYNAPTDELSFLLNDVFNVEEILSLDSYKDFSGDLINAILEEGGKFASEKLSPINKSGDEDGAKISDGVVKTSPGFSQAYKEFIDNGWNSAPFPTQYGGQGLPNMLTIALFEFFSGANMAFSLCPLLTHGAAELLINHASDQQKEKYLTNLVSGKWTATMCLTEPQAGSDLGAINTKAIADGDHYKISGQKIFITYGEHDFTENIIHLVLARTQNAPAGSGGISLFIVPKILDDNKRNDVKAISLEHKLGIHGSPTAVMSFGDNNECVGYLVGQENMGLKYMFTMMNSARLSVGVEGIAIAENSLQKAAAYASERKQFGSSIDQYPDIYETISKMRSKISTMRALSIYIAKLMDISEHHDDTEEREKSKKYIGLLIPVIKSYGSQMGFEISSDAMQIFGGTGYVEETGIAQNLRDSRIAMIYEGTNGIQAIDLIKRKILMDEGKTCFAFIDEIQNFYDHNLNKIDLLNSQSKQLLNNSLSIIKDITKNILEDKSDSCLKIASIYLELFAYISSSYMAVMILSQENAKQHHKQDCQYYISNILPNILAIDYIIQQKLKS